MIDFGDQISAKVDKSNYDPAAAAAHHAAHDAQAPDPPVRPTVEKNVTSKGREVLPPEVPEGRRGLRDSKDKSETSEEQRAEAVLQGGPDVPTQKLPSVIKPVILVANDDSAVNSEHRLHLVQRGHQGGGRDAGGDVRGGGAAGEPDPRGLRADGQLEDDPVSRGQRQVHRGLRPQRRRRRGGVGEGARHLGGDNGDSRAGGGGGRGHGAPSSRRSSRWLRLRGRCTPKKNGESKTTIRTRGGHRTMVGALRGLRFAQ